MSEQTPAAAFAAALVEFQKDVPRVGKGQTASVGSYSYTYADLADVSEAALPALTAHGLAFNAKPAMTDAGFVLRCSLRHVGGFIDEGDYPLPDPAKHTPQEVGSAFTYARRYALCAMTGITPSGEDDDGQKASEARAAQRAEADDSQRLTRLKREITDLGKFSNLNTVDELRDDYAAWAQGEMLADADEAQLTAYRDYLDEERKRGLREHKALAADVTNTTQAGKGRKDSPDKGRVERTSEPDPDDAFAVPAGAP